MSGGIFGRAVVWGFATVLGAELALASVGAAGAAEMRTWADGSGQYQIKAKLLRVEGENVFLQREDGEEFKIELAQLSAGDQQYVKNNAPSTAGGPVKKQTGLVNFNPSAAKAVSPIPKGGWKFTVADSPQTVPPGQQIIALPPMRDFFEHTTGLLVNIPGRRALIAYVLDKPPLEKMTRLVLCNLEDGHTIERFGPGNMIPLALSPSGNQVLMREDTFSPHKKDCLELWTFTGSGIEPTLQWYPKGDGRTGGTEIQWAEFVDDDRLVTVSQRGMLVVWQFNPLKPLYYLKIDGRGIPAISPDRQYLVCTSNGQISVLDLKLGTLLATNPVPDAGWKNIAFSPSGRRLACAGGSGICVWDFQTGEHDRTLWMTGVFGIDRILWTNEKYILIGKNSCLLVGVDTRLKLWQYQSLDSIACSGGVCCLLPRQNSGKPGALLALQLPHPGAKEALDEAAADPDFYVVGPGVTARLDLDSLPSADAREKVRTVLTARLEANGCHAGTRGTIDLVATIEREKSEPNCSCRLRLVYQGQTVWETATWVPADGSSEYAWFLTVALPPIVTKGGFNEALGNSEVTPSGLQDKQKGPIPRSRGIDRRR